MERERQNIDEQVNDSRGFPSQRRMMSSIFGGKDPFDDPFFTRPFGSTIKPSIFDTDSDADDDGYLPHPNATGSKELIIEEIDSDDEAGEEGNNITSEVNDKKFHEGGTLSGNAPVIEHPDDEDEVTKDLSVNKNHNRIKKTKPQSHSVSFKKVTYGGINGAYYSATTTRKSGSDGVVLEDSKEADKTTGRATHRISKGIQDKGHSVTRKLGTDGKVDTVQTLHNLNEDELVGFEQDWKGNADWHIPGWDEEFGSFGRTGSGSMRPFGLSLQSADRSRNRGRTSNDGGTQTSSFGGRRKKVVTINID